MGAQFHPNGSVECLENSITFQGLYLDLCMVLIMMRHSLLWPRSICMRIDTPCHQPSLACAFIDVICFE